MMVERDKALNICRNKAEALMGADFCAEHSDSRCEAYGMEGKNNMSFFLGFEKDHETPGELKIQLDEKPYDYRVSLQMNLQTGDTVIEEAILPK